MDALIPRNPTEHFSSLKHRLGWFTHSTSKKIWRINNLELQTLTPSVWAPTRFPTRDVIFYYNKENYLLKNTKMCLSSNPWHCPTDKNTHFLDDHLANPFLKNHSGSGAHFLMDLEIRAHEVSLFLWCGLRTG